MSGIVPDGLTRAVALCTINVQIKYNQTRRTTLSTTDVAPDISDLDVPMSASVPEPDGDFNRQPPPLPELFDPENPKRAVPYIVDIRLGRNGIKKEAYDVKNNGVATGEKAAYYTADVLCRAVAVADGRDFEFGRFNALIAPDSRYSSFVQQGKPMSDLVHLAQIAGLNINPAPVGPYGTVGELVADLNTVLAKRDADVIQAKAYIQWQWWSKLTTFTRKNGEQKTGKTVRYGMAQADRNSDGAPMAAFVHKDTGETLIAKAVIVKLETL